MTHSDVVLEQGRERAESELQDTVHGLDGSPAARTMYVQARAENRDAEQIALAVLDKLTSPLEFSTPHRT